MVGISSTADLDCLGHVLLMPWRGRFMCPLAVAGLGLRYFMMSFSVKLGHPLRKPLLVAFNRVDILGLHSTKIDVQI
jgi:hypothetical protein